MFSQDDKYQNLLAQLHELNRQNLLNDNEKNEELLQRIEYLTSIIENKENSNKNSDFLYKILYVVIGITLINTLLCFFIIFNLNTDETNIQEIQTPENIQKTEEIIQTPKKIVEETVKEEPMQEIEQVVEDEKIEKNAISFNQEIVEEQTDDNFEEMKPIIKKDTIYSCEDDNYTKIYKIPYTVEIKGKLYEDRFVFILQNDSGTRKCMINKNDM